MATTVLALFKDAGEAEAAVRALRSAHFESARLGIVQKDSKDASGKPYGEELAKAQEGVFSEVSYLSPRPGADKTPIQKIAFVTKVSGYICLVGYAP